MGTTNTRAAQRVKVEAFVKVTGADKEYVFRTRDLSMNGLFLFTRVAHIYPFRVGSAMKLELYDYDQFVSANVVVARIVEPNSAEADHYPTGIGVRIVHMDADSKARLKTMIDKAATGSQLY